jgi:hypothetical protein
MEQLPEISPLLNGLQDKSKYKALLLELIVGVVLGLFLLILNYKDLAAITWIIAGFQSLGRFEYSRQLAEELAPVKKLAEIVDLRKKCSVDDIRNILDLYVQITDDNFERVKIAAVREASIKLSRLAFQKRSDTLATGEYYNWLLAIIKDTQPGSEIWAVSMMLSCEWDDTAPENHFLDYNLDAAKRGVTIRRVFVVPEAMIVDLPNCRPVAAQIDPANKIDALLVAREYLEEKEKQLLANLGDGLIAFDQRVILIDEHSKDGTARGYVTINPGEIATRRYFFESLLPHAEKLSDGIARRVNAKCATNHQSSS